MSDEDVRSYFKLTELTKWTSLSQFEIFNNLVWFLIFTIYLTVKLTLRDSSQFSNYVVNSDNSTDYISHNHHNNNNYQNYRADIEWFKVFIPLFVSDLLNAYFCIIVTIRLIHANKLKIALHRLFWTLNFLMLNILFKYLLCLKLSAQSGSGLEYAEVFSPIFILFVIYCSRLCHI